MCLVGRSVRIKVAEVGQSSRLIIGADAVPAAGFMVTLAPIPDSVGIPGPVGERVREAVVDTTRQGLTYAGPDAVHHGMDDQSPAPCGKALPPPWPVTGLNAGFDVLPHASHTLIYARRDALVQTLDLAAFAEQIIPNAV